MPINCSIVKLPSCQLGNLFNNLIRGNNMENAVKKDYLNDELQQTIEMLDMFAEKYLELENENSNKMMLEISLGWDCKSVVIV